MRIGALMEIHPVSPDQHNINDTHFISAAMNHRPMIGIGRFNSEILFHRELQSETSGGLRISRYLQRGIVASLLCPIVGDEAS